jgi:hypothetical protein
MCGIADQLRFALYAVTPQFSNVELPLSAEIKAAIERQREDPEYQQALDALREHLMRCEECTHGRV